MNFIRKNQVIIYVIAFMLVTAGYLNYTARQENIQTSIEGVTEEDEFANIGDATLVSSNDIKQENSIGSVSLESINNVENNVQIQNDVNQISDITVETNTSTAINNSDYFVKSKLERDTMYSQMIENYEKILNSSNSLETQKQSATEEIENINNIKNKIMICENLIKTKGFENSVIFVNEKSINIIVGASEIKQEEIAQIQNIISREMNAEIEDIHISTK